MARARGLASVWLSVEARAGPASAAQHGFLEVRLYRMLAEPDLGQRAVEGLARNGALRAAVHEDACRTFREIERARGGTGKSARDNERAGQRRPFPAHAMHRQNE